MSCVGTLRKLHIGWCLVVPVWSPFGGSELVQPRTRAHVPTYLPNPPVIDCMQRIRNMEL